jgi:hypothetical protein
LTAVGAIRSFTTEGTEATEAAEAAEAGRKGVSDPAPNLFPFRSVSVISVPSVVKSGANLRETVVSTHEDEEEGTRRA